MKAALFFSAREAPAALVLLALVLILPACAPQQGGEAGSSGAERGVQSRKAVRRHDTYLEYLAYLTATVKKHWRYEPGPSSMEPEVDLYIEMDRDGGIDTVKIIKSTGNRAFERSCLKALKAIGRFDPPPRDWPLTFTMSLSPAALRSSGKGA